MKVLRTVKLPFVFDTAALRSDLTQIRPEYWVLHFNKTYHDGGWMGVALRSSRGQTSDLFVPLHEELKYEDTELLERCPAVRELLRAFQCAVRSVRFLRLVPGAKIREHRDHDLTLESGLARMHVPIVTNPQVDFFLDANRVEMQPGECWYLNFSLPHWIENKGDTDRIHLVIDCEVNQWLADLLSAAESKQAASVAGPMGPCSTEALEQFLQTALSNPVLQERLRVTADNESFARLAVELGQESGYFFDVSHVETALQKARQQWRQQATSY
jgi:hypothetical protein